MQRFTSWARAHGDVSALGLIGSWARGTARPDSDVDIVLLTRSVDDYARDPSWVRDLLGAEFLGTRAWGAITEIRLALPSRLEVEVDVGDPSWAATDPVDAGTRAVVRDELRILHDPEGLLGRLTEACRR
ncbi:MAG: nucleotidyltransferase domain-containing protein [Actinomycetota bacterium]